MGLENGGLSRFAQLRLGQWEVEATVANRIRRVKPQEEVEQESRYALHRVRSTHESFCINAALQEGIYIALDLLPGR